MALLLALFHSELLAQNKIKVACIGNSITFGVGVKNPKQNSYPAQLSKMLGDKYNVQPFGKSGATLLSSGHCPYIKDPIFTKALAFDADVIVMHLGVNDTDPRDWPYFGDFFVTDYINLIEAFRAVNPKVRVLIATITPITNRHPRFSSGTYQWQGEIRKAIVNVAKATNVELIDFFTPLYSFPYMLPDAIHPNEEGAAVIAKEACMAITGDYGGLQMPILYSDNMVLQHGVPINIEGIANVGERIDVSVGAEKYTTITSNVGKWSVIIEPLEGGASFQLSIEAQSRKLTYNNAIAGEVWLCSGQSNMAFALKSATGGKQKIAKAKNDNIRIFNMLSVMPGGRTNWSNAQLEASNRLDFYKPTSWQQLSSANAADFSAVAYYFGEMLEEELELPIGLIANSVGGSTVESWIDRNTIERMYPLLLRDVRTNDFTQEWARGRASVHLKNAIFTQQRHFFEACYLHEAGIKPLNKYPIKGVIWYQGESNAHNIEMHNNLFKLLVSSWRENWNNERMPFYYVQLSSINRTSWPRFRDDQRKLMRVIPYTGMAVSSDRGLLKNVHPHDKEDIGYRLARWALNKTYGKKITPSGPLFKSASCNDGVVSVSFDYGKGLSTSDGKAIRTFELAEIEGVYFPAEATVGRGVVKVTSSKVRNPKYVRYAWQPYTEANLVNSDMLPASTFKSAIE